MIFTITTIILTVLLLSILDIIFVVPILNVSQIYIVTAIILSVTYEIIIDGLFVLIVNRISNSKFEKGRIYFNVSRCEQKFLELLGIRKWKDKIWTFGSVKKINLDESFDYEYANKLIIDSNKRIFEYILGAIAGFSVVLIFPLRFMWIVGIPIAIVNLFLNLLPIMVLKYNLPKLEVLKKRVIRNKATVMATTKINLDNKKDVLN